MNDLFWRTVHDAARRDDWHAATAAALAALELSEPETLHDALALTTGRLDRGLVDDAIRLAWPAYHHDRGRAWN